MLKMVNPSKDFKDRDFSKASERGLLKLCYTAGGSHVGYIYYSRSSEYVVWMIDPYNPKNKKRHVGCANTYIGAARIASNAWRRMGQFVKQLSGETNEHSKS